MSDAVLRLSTQIYDELIVESLAKKVGAMTTISQGRITISLPDTDAARVILKNVANDVLRVQREGGLR